jgi:aryl-alcohol dehydrogenase-like predicted oxidoreductase
MTPPLKHMITNLAGEFASRLGLAAHPQQDPRCVRRAYEQGIGFFFFYGPNPGSFGEAIAPLARKQREKMVVASGSGSRTRSSLLAARRKILTGIGIETLDVFFAEYINPTDDPTTVFGKDGVLDELQRWKAEGLIRYVGATAHDRKLAKQLAADSRVDVLMHRFNMAHRKATREVFPTAVRAKTPVIAFTATRWRSLLEPHADWSDPPPSAADCYRYCLAHSAVQLALTSPQTVEELEENLEVLASAPMNDRERVHWERYGDLVYGRGADAFETKWD